MVAINGMDLFVEEVGSGEPLVLVHGSWGDHFEWAFVQPSLAESCRVIAYDRRGHSASGPARGCVADDVADLAALIEERVAGPAFVYGTSFGGSWRCGWRRLDPTWSGLFACMSRRRSAYFRRAESGCRETLTGCAS